MATRSQDLCRFFINYQKLIILIGIALTVQILLGIHVVFWQGNWNISGDGSKGPYDSLNVQRSQLLSQGQSDKLPGKGNNGGNDNKVTVQGSRINSSLLLLDLESLSFVPGCNITLKDSISAINRAKTQQCKEEIANLSCDILDDSLYVKRLPRFCKNAETKYGRYLGCYKDNPRDRILSDHISVFKDKNCPQVCIDLCLQSGFQYAGLQYGVECFCGNSKPSSSINIKENMCDLPCPPKLGSSSTSTNSFLNQDDIKLWNGNCGGYFTMNVFETGVFQDYEINNKIVGLDGRKEDGTLAEKPMRKVRIVFFLTLNGRSIRQVFRLIKALFHERHFFYIHIDMRQDYLFRELLVLSQTLPNNVRFMRNRKATIWGGASLLTILLSGMEDLVANAETWNWDWDYVINLSESDFPLKTTEKLEEFLSHNRGRNFVKSHGRDVQKFIQKQGLDKTFYECEYRMWRIADRKLPLGIMIDGGSDWIALHRDFVNYVITTSDQLVTGLKTVFKHTLLPAESFFHTVLRNSVHCSSFVDNNLHVTNWKRKLGCKCQYRNVVDWCGCSPNDFRLTDWNRLTLAESRIIFFGRKFEAIVNQGIINKFESWLYPERFETHYPTMDRFWQSLYHQHDLSPKPDDTLVTLGLSLARIAAHRFAIKYNCSIVTKHHRHHNSNSRSGSNDEDIVKLVEITAYNHDDKFQGILIRFNSPVTKNNQDSFEGIPEVFTLSLETWFQLDSSVEMAPWSSNIAKYRSKIQDIAVGVEYEQKEQIFRNFARNIGPFSEPVLTYSIASDEPFNITAVFIDPSNSVQAVANSSISEGSTSITNFIKPSIKTPMEAGIWTVKILSVEGYLIATVKMLVLPLEIYQGKRISLKYSSQINKSTVKTGSNKEQIAGDDDSQEEAKQRTNLRSWIDSLTTDFYSIQDFCLESEQNHLLLSRWKSEDKAMTVHPSKNAYGSQQKTLFQNDDETKKIDYDHSLNNNEMDAVIETSLCSHAQWSSLFPDPKSTITGIDPKTGLLLP